MSNEALFIKVASVGSLILMFVGVFIIGCQYIPVHAIGTDDTVTHIQYTYGGDNIDLEVRNGDVDGFNTTWYVREMPLAITGTQFYTPNDPTLVKLYEMMKPALDTMSDREKAESILRFVQRNVDYLSDVENQGKRDYSQLPVETLITKQGDCEDMAILTANLYLMAGLDAALVLQHNHVAPVVSLDDVDGDFITHPLSGKRYIIGEPTSLMGLGSSYNGDEGQITFIDRPSTGYMMAFVIFLISAALMCWGHSAHHKLRKEAE